MIFRFDKLQQQTFESKYRHPASQLVMVALVTLTSLIVFLILGSIIAIPVWGIDKFSQIIQATVEYSRDDVHFLKYLQVIQSVGLFVVPSLILAKFFGQHSCKYLKMNKKPLLVSVILSIVVIFVSNPMINATGVINSRMSFPEWMSGIENWMRSSEQTAEELTRIFLDTKNAGGLLFNIFMIGIIPAIGEELLFRGIIQRIFTNWTRNHHLGIWITAILFSALHFQFYGFLPRAILGVIFGYLLVISGNLWLPVIAHFINNTVAVIAYYLYGKGVIGFDPDTLGAESGFGVAAAVSLLFIVLLFIIIARKEKTEALKKQLFYQGDPN